MMKIIKELNIEVAKPNILQAVVAKQYDMNSRFLKIRFIDSGTHIDIPTTAKVVINAERIDGQSNSFEGVVNNDGTVTVPLHSWMLELEGTVICDISAIDTTENDEGKLSTTSFTLIVEKSAHGGSDISNDPQYDVLLNLIERVENLSVSGGGGGSGSGENGATFTPSVSADGVLSWTNDKGLANPTSVNIKGDTGASGSAGKDGTSVTITKVTESTADGGSNVVTFSDGKTVTIKNGSKGSSGANGADGKTPVKGTDYFTAADKTEMVNAVISALPKYTGGVS